MAAALASIGAAIGLNVIVAAPMHARHDVPLWDGMFAIPETLAFVFAFEWMLQILRTDILFPQSSQKRRRHGFALHRFGQEPRHCDTGVDNDTHQKYPSSLDWRSISTAQSPPASLVL